ncbi:MAG: IPT/TIG domain-containing protein [Gemmatimonadota bacterium]
MSSFTPNPALAGERVIVHGANFGIDPSAVTVTFGGIRGTVISASNDRIERSCPLGCPPVLTRCGSPWRGASA